MRVEPDLGNPDDENGRRRSGAPDALPRGEELPRAHRRLQAGVALQRLGPVAAFGFLQRVAALVKSEGLRVLAPVLERLAERETQMIPVGRLNVRRRLARSASAAISASVNR